MKLYRLRRHGDALRPTQEQESVKELGKTEVRVRVEAASLNYRDLDELQGGDGGYIPLSDAAGRVDAVGADVQRWKIGDRVAVNFFPTWTDGPFKQSYLRTILGSESADGVLAEYTVQSQDSLVSLPEHLTMEEAATLPCAGVTAWRALVDRANISRGDTVLVQGTGGVALFGLQLAASMGARVIVISSSDAKLERVRALGASILINYRERPDWDKAVMEHTGGAGANLVLELGGPTTLERSIRSVSAGGTIALIGALGGSGSPPSIGRIHAANAGILGLTVGSVQHFDALNAHVSEHRIRPVIDRVFGFDEVPAAYDHLRSGTHFGKVVVRVA